MIRKLAHLCLVTDQLDKMLDFYHRGIGFDIKFTFYNKENQVFGYYLACGDLTFIEIFDRVLKNKMWGQPGSEAKPLKDGNKIDHLCFECIDLPAMQKELESRGVVMHRPIKLGMDSSYQMWSTDPDGNLIEFMEYTTDSWQFRGNSRRGT